MRTEDIINLIGLSCFAILGMVWFLLHRREKRREVLARRGSQEWIDAAENFKILDSAKYNCFMKIDGKFVYGRMKNGGVNDVSGAGQTITSSSVNSIAGNIDDTQPVIKKES